MNDRYVPRNLIPTDRHLMDIEWAKKTYRYARLFDLNQYPSMFWNDNSQLVQWISFAYKIQDELRHLGKLAAEKRIVQYFKDYHITMVSDNTMFPKNFDDVFSIIADTTWYENNIEFKRNLIYMVGYGIFRKGYNMWAKTLECEWLRKHSITLKHISLDGHEITSGKERCGKGFVYSNITMRASNYLNEKVITIMKTNHQEFICVRKKGEPIYNYRKMTFQHFDGYLVTFDNHMEKHLPDLILQKRKIKK